MKKWTSVDKCLTSDGRTISLWEHDADYAIRLGGVTLMSTRQHASEEELADLACAHLIGNAHARLLVGGLGFGFTLRAALSKIPPDAIVVVAEILPEVIAWNRNRSFNFAADCLNDPRVRVLQQDVGEVIRDTRGGFDSIILDVDNGPAALSTESNRRLYDYAGLQLARSALRPGGRLAIWSAAPERAFERLVASAGFRVDVRDCRAGRNSGPRHTIFLCKVK